MTNVQVEALDVQVLAVGSPKTQVEAINVQVLSVGTPKTQVEQIAVQVLVPTPPHVVEYANVVLTGSASPVAVSFLNTVRAGDVVVLMCSHYTSTTPAWAVSGLGATWTSRRRDTGDAAIEVFTATAVSDGDLTITFGAATWRSGYAVWLLRGVTEGNVVDSVFSSTTSINGPSQISSPGQIVCTYGVMQNSSAGGYALPRVYSPTTDWVGAATNGTAYTRTWAKHREGIDASPTAHQITDSTASAAKSYRITQVVIGTAPTSSALFAGATDIMALKVGSTTVNKVYLGSSQVYP